MKRINDKGQNAEMDINRRRADDAMNDAFVLDKGIFSNIFDKDIRRVYLYKKTERLAKAVHLITPAFKHSPPLRDKLDLIALGLVDGAVLPPLRARAALARELLALSSVLAIARTGGILSPMNADLISRESHQLLQEIATYEEPRVVLAEVPTFAELARSSGEKGVRHGAHPPVQPTPKRQASTLGHSLGHEIAQKGERASRQEAILDVLKTRGPSYIKDISTIIREVSEKTIQRELQALVLAGGVLKEGERRWTRYSLPGTTD